ncbi:MAG: transcriptional repressor [Parasporobacterium sp.]|nr:transcriptional repressor [Parasporobacterium sp.]
METKGKYKTKQKEILVNYLKSMPGVHFTAGDICDYMKTQGETIGQSTVYRRLESLVDEGILNKYTVDGTSSACFEYVGADSHGNETVCYHCKCEKCGKLIHLHCDEIKEIQEHLLKGHRFQMDPRRTVFYGLCEKCRGANE